MTRLLAVVVSALIIAAMAHGISEPRPSDWGTV
jgi:hypothetical protein